jgi:4-alpha-glucanotransferase
VSDSWGIEAEYLDITGQTHHVDPATIQTLRGLIGQAPEPDAAPLFARPGARWPGAGVIELEYGGELPLTAARPEDLPVGYHRLHPDQGPARPVIVSPHRCRRPERRMWGWAAQLYATRSRASWGIGDLADLRTLARWSAADLHAGFLLINPLGATSPVGPQQPSPYFPASRRFRNPIYLRVEDVPGAGELGEELAAAARAGQALNDERRIDRDRVWELKLAALEAVWARTAGGKDFTAWSDQAPDALRQFACWAALTERFGADWRAWPDPYRRPTGPAVARFATENPDRIRFHAWLQRNLEMQLADAARNLTLIQDLPIGVDPAGFDAWAWQDLLATGVSVGAPPDELNAAGQDWGLPPFVPWRLAQAGYQPFIDTIRATLSSGGLRIDHVMGLFRLWWIPEGAGAAAGAYVRYPHEDLLDIVALESARSDAVVIGEDLGTVEDSARQAMTERHLLSYRLLWFENDPPTTWPPTAMAAVTTHDLPTVAGLWDGSDLATQSEVGLEPNVESTDRIRQRLSTATGPDPQATAEQAVPAAYNLLAKSPCLLLTATLDDALAESERPNIPGADGRRPNWSLALPMALDELRTHLLTARLAEILGQAVAQDGCNVRPDLPTPTESLDVQETP